MATERVSTSYLRLQQKEVGRYISSSERRLVDRNGTKPWKTREAEVRHRLLHRPQVCIRALCLLTQTGCIDTLKRSCNTHLWSFVFVSQVPSGRATFLHHAQRRRPSVLQLVRRVHTWRRDHQRRPTYSRRGFARRYVVVKRVSWFFLLLGHST